MSKQNHAFALEYTARLLRFTVNHHGPLKHRKIHDWIRRPAVEEFRQFLTA
jgi:phosphoribosyl-dephospho-CoA transferase